MLYVFLALVLVAAVAAALLKLSTAQAKAAAGSGIEARRICSDNELEFFHRLQRALPGHCVFTQVSANALLRVSPSVPKKSYHAMRNRFAQKHVDFVVCEQGSLSVLAIIELDDRTHRAEKDKVRDSMFELAGYRIYRFESRRKPSEDEIAALFAPPVEPESVQF